MYKRSQRLSVRFLSKGRQRPKSHWEIMCNVIFAFVLISKRAQCTLKFYLGESAIRTVVVPARCLRCARTTVGKNDDAERAERILANPMGRPNMTTTTKGPSSPFPKHNHGAPYGSHVLSLRMLVCLAHSTFMVAQCDAIHVCVSRRAAYILQMRSTCRCPSGCCAFLRRLQRRAGCRRRWHDQLYP